MKPIEPGCRAIMTHHTAFGWPVLVEGVAPDGVLTLPNGAECEGYGVGRWIVRSLAAPMFPIRSGVQKDGMYGVCPEQYLLRIDGNPDTVQTTEREKVFW